MFVIESLAEKPPSRPNRSHPLEIAERLAGEFAQTAVERDKRGGTAKAERDQLRESGLLNLLIPTSEGGLGAEWPEIFRIIRLFARVDSSIAHLFGFQHLMLATVELFGTEAQRRHYYTQTVANNWFWGNALNPLDVHTTVSWKGDKRVVNGRKGFASGSADADALIVSAVEPGNPRLLIAAVPLPREGVAVRGDWDNMGQRQTDSGTVEFADAVLEDEEILRSPGPLGSTRATLRPCIAQLIFSNIFLGIAEGAFNEARTYTSAQTRSWITSNVETPQEDPYILRHYGEIYAQLQAAKLVTDRAGDSFQRAWEIGDAITENHRGRAALDIATAKVITTQSGLDIVNRMFEVMGSRSTTGSARLDRYWRNLRTQTLHDPVDYKLRELGDWSLNRRIPNPSFYS
ncbi:acyl-CoA dehydrogenase family protein [Verrucomicrobium sp. BvORR034]|jgi:alkylation response protein AidB-like acyl-CoA dehydrogenase|uniref:acyl-CoA dehydrogenase family protein n=1 Tax=Verrucomicrobium sp. BvORR034 TaxID=1396418 RepID=UPI0006787489|nr:acyl-CoA dehydrogenase family protein [Verrucomicrobium sp. BvORR034]